MFSFSDLEPQHILTGAQVRTNVAGMKETKKKKKKQKQTRGQKKEKRDGYGSNPGKRRVEKRRFVDRILSWKIFQLAKANKKQARTYFHTDSIGTPNQWQ